MCRPRRRKCATCWEGRGRRCHLPVGLDRPVRDRQGDEISYGSPLYDHCFVWVMNKAHLRGDVDGAAEGDRRPLQQGMGGKSRRTLGRLRARPASPSSRPSPTTRSIRSPRRNSTYGKRRRARGANLVGRGDKGWQRSRRGAEGPLNSRTPPNPIPDFDGVSSSSASQLS